MGDNAKVGAGSVVVSDVPKNSTVVGNPGRPVLLQGQRVGIPDIDYRHLPDPVAEAVKCLVARIVEMEKELDEIHPERKGKRQEAVRRRRRTMHRASCIGAFDEGAGQSDGAAPAACASARAALPPVIGRPSSTRRLSASPVTGGAGGYATIAAFSATRERSVITT